MKKLTFIILIAISALFSQESADISPFLSDPSTQPTPSDAIWEVVAEYNLTDICGMSGNAGCEFDGNNFYITQWSENIIFRINPETFIVDTLAVEGVSGLRDLAWDGNYMYGGNAGSDIYCFNPETMELVDVIETSHSYRAIAYDGKNEGFWGNNWIGDLACIDRDGNIITTIVDPGIQSAYGLAYDDYELTGGNGPYLWVFEQGAGGGYPQYIRQIPVESGTFSGTQRDVVVDFGLGIAGGLFMTDEFADEKAVLGGVLQAQPDVLFLYEIYNYTGIEDENTPDNYMLRNYPNPFNPETNISYVLNKEANVSIAIYDSKGNTVEKLNFNNQNIGHHSFNFDGYKLSSGFYTYSLIVDGKAVKNNKMALIK